MDDSEEILKALQDFKNSEIKQLTEQLKSIIGDVARTGKYRIQWDLLKPLYLQALDEVMKDFIENLPPKTSDGIDIQKVNELKETAQSLKDSFTKFTSAPFTLQRISELLIDPRLHYKNSMKFFRGLEKNVLVVSTFEPEPADEKPAKRQKLDASPGDTSESKQTSTLWFVDDTQNPSNGDKRMTSSESELRGEENLGEERPVSSPSEEREQYFDSGITDNKDEDDNHMVTTDDATNEDDATEQNDNETSVNRQESETPLSEEMMDYVQD